MVSVKQIIFKDTFKSTLNFCILEKNDPTASPFLKVLTLNEIVAFFKKYVVIEILFGPLAVAQMVL